MIKSLKIRLASPETIRKWSYGEVTSDETINYRTQKIVKDGLFCERIFGPVKDYECSCGKYKGKQYSGVVCERCGVEVVCASLRGDRRERMGHIELAVPVVHPWFRAPASKLSLLLNIPANDLDNVIYYNAYMGMLNFRVKLQVKKIISCLEEKEVSDDELTYEKVLSKLFTTVKIKSEDGIKYLGYIIARDIVNKNNEIIFRRGEKLDPKIIKSITSNNIPSFFIFTGNEFQMKPKKFYSLIVDDIPSDCLDFIDFLTYFDVSLTIVEKDVSKYIVNVNKDASKEKVEVEVKGVIILPDNEDYREKVNKVFTRYNENFKLKMGGEAIYDILHSLDLEKLSTQIKNKIKFETDPEKKKKLLKRLDIVEGFRLSGTLPEWIVLKVIPVLPPDLRPLVSLEGGRFAASDLNDLYRRVIARNNRLKTFKKTFASEVIIKMECRLVQEAVDALFDNSHKRIPLKSRSGVLLKSLSDILRGKEGRFRRNLLGKRVDYSGRAVIVVDPKLKINECGLPKNMAIELFKPFTANKIRDTRITKTKLLKKYLEKGDEEAWKILESVVKNHPILLNRAPTLHRLSIQGFFPKIVEGDALRISPLICPPFNADFDGDTMSVYVPLTLEAQTEALLLLMSSNNILSPAHGKPISIPTQDGVIGVYWLTKEKEFKGKERYFSNANEVEIALQNNVVNIHDKIKYWVDGKFIDTTVGRVIFNKVIPEGIEFVNKTVDKKELIEIISKIYKKLGSAAAVKFLDDVKDIGYEYATKSGLTIGMDDVSLPINKEKIINEAKLEIEKINEDYKNDLITDSERYNNIIDTWSYAVDKIEEETKRVLMKDKGGFNPLYMMAISGARGNIDQVRQIIGVRGLISGAAKGAVEEIKETPILSSFREGLTPHEYFISTWGARKGLTDTALKTSQAGYLTRKLVDCAQDIRITEEDCGGVMGIRVSAVREGGKIIEPLWKRITGKFALEDVVNPITSEVIVFAGEEITEEKAKEIEECGIDSVYISSVLSCESKYGVCRRCYGRDLATGKLVEIGEPVGIIGAQSIGEPGTQLTLRTFHTGGIASRITEESELKAPFDGKITFEGIHLHVRKDGTKVVIEKGGKIYLRGSAKDKEGKEVILEKSYKVQPGFVIMVDDGSFVNKDQVIFKWDPYSFPIVSGVSGIVKYSGLIKDVTYRLEVDERTGKKHPVVMPHRKEQPSIEIWDNGKLVASYLLPTRAHILVTEGQKVEPSDLLAKVPRVEIVKSSDITCGLPRVIELFEARHPKNKAIVSKIDGTVVIPTTEPIISEIDGIVELRPEIFAEIDGEVEIKYTNEKEISIVVHGENEDKKYEIQSNYYRCLVNDGQKIMKGKKLASPKIIVVHSGSEYKEYEIPFGYDVNVKDGEEVKAGTMLAEEKKGIVSEIDGMMEVSEIDLGNVRGKIIIIHGEGVEKEYEVPLTHRVKKGTEFVKKKQILTKRITEGRVVIIHGSHQDILYVIPFSKHLLVYDGEEIMAGDKLTDGPIDPHDILEIKGIQATQQLLVNQIKEVYRLQGVEIADNHIEIIVRQMLSRVRIKDAGDTSFIEGDIVPKITVDEENERVKKITIDGSPGRPAKYEPVLLGISKTILTGNSFIAAAAFQETTRVLTHAAIHGKEDKLLGIKENVIVGNLIPAGTGERRFLKE